MVSVCFIIFRIGHLYVVVVLLNVGLGFVDNLILKLRSDRAIFLKFRVTNDKSGYG